MEMLKKNKGTLAAIAIFIVAMFLYKLFFKSENVAIPSELSASSIADDFIKMRGELQAVTLDQGIFSSPGYLLLTDFSTAIPQQITGRPNPFNIIGRD
ncbi:MAG: hypothetical protein Q7R89_02700 [bacterium]|nr:hypothetical protein [bacterium]